MSHASDRELIIPNSRDGFSAGICGAAAVLGVVIGAIVSSSGRGDDRVAEIEERPAITGRIADEIGKPVANARIRLYRRENRWQRHDPVVAESTSRADGSFILGTGSELKATKRSPEFPQWVVLADHPGKAVGWATFRANAPSYEANVVLSPPSERTITVIDAHGVPVAGAMIAAYSVGDPAASAPHLASLLDLRPSDGPLTATTGADGRATLKQLPRTRTALLAQKPGFAEGYAFEDQDTIRLTPSASLSGTVTSPDGAPAAGVEVVLFADFMWHFERTVTDAKGKYAFDDLRANGWDMSAWRSNQKGNGKYRIWLDNDRFAIPTQTIVFEPSTPYVFDIQAQRAGVVKLTVLEEGTDKPVAGVRIWGFDAETGSSGRFNAYTDDHGHATFYSVPTKLNLSIAGPPEGVYLKGDLRQSQRSSIALLFDGRTVETTLVMPPIGGPLIGVSGTCMRSDGKLATDVTVSGNAGRVVASGSMSFIRGRQTDGQGRFTLSGVPAGLPLHIYAETKDRKFAGTLSSQIPPNANGDFRLTVNLGPTVTVDGVFKDDAGKPVGAKKFHVTPQVQEQDFPFLRRDAESDAEGRFKIDGIVPGLHYRVEEVVAPQPRAVAIVPGGRLPWYQEILILAPKDGK